MTLPARPSDPQLTPVNEDGWPLPRGRADDRTEFAGGATRSTLTLRTFRHGRHRVDTPHIGYSE
jgi:hypothetical protein